MSGKDARQVRLAYVGDEQLSWARQAFAARRHYYVMPAVLYLQAVLEQRALELGIGGVEVCYLNRALHDYDTMLERLAAGAPRVVGLSCYSWNIQDCLALAQGLKARVPGVAVVLGGPEVSYDDIREAVALCEAHPCLDAVVLGEGEGVVVEVVRALLDPSQLEPIPNTVLRRGEALCHSERVKAPVDLALLPPIDPAGVEIPRTPGTGRAIVYQTYRGCPYTCAYCGFHGGAPGIRRFPLERLEQELVSLFAAEVELINFADAVFDINLGHAKSILRACLAHNRCSSLLAYVAFQTIDEELADLFTQTGIQLGVGLQSWHEDVLRACKRHFSLERFRRVMEVVRRREINYYIDLMFGLPEDSLDKFRATFEQVLALRPPFVMPFPLTVIPRSELHADIGRFGVVRYSDAELRAEVRPTSGMVYADIGLFHGFSLADLRRFDDMATAVFFSFQRYPRTLQLLSDYGRQTQDRGHGLDTFAAFERLGLRLRERLGGEPVDLNRLPLIDGTLREAFVEVLLVMGAGPVEREALTALLKLEAAAANLLERPDRKALHEGHTARRARSVVALADTPAESLVALAAPCRVVPSPFAFAALERLCVLGAEIPAAPSSVLVRAPWGDWRVSIVDLNPVEAAVCQELPPAREIKLGALSRKLERTFAADEIRAALASLLAKGVIDIVEP